MCPVSLPSTINVTLVWLISVPDKFDFDHSEYLPSWFFVLIFVSHILFCWLIPVSLLFSPYIYNIYILRHSSFSQMLLLSTFLLFFLLLLYSFYFQFFLFWGTYRKYENRKNIIYGNDKHNYEWCFCRIFTSQDTYNHRNSNESKISPERALNKSSYNSLIFK